MLLFSRSGSGIYYLLLSFPLLVCCYCCYLFSLETFSSHPSLLRVRVQQGGLFASPHLLLEAAAATREAVGTGVAGASSSTTLPSGCAAVTVFLLHPIVPAACLSGAAAIAGGGVATPFFSAAGLYTFDTASSQPHFLFDTVRVCVGSSTLLPTAAAAVALHSSVVSAAAPSSLAGARAEVAVAATPLRVLPFSTVHLLLPGSLAPPAVLPQQLSFHLSFKADLLCAAAAAVMWGHKSHNKGTSCSDAHFLQVPLLPQSVAAGVSLLFSSILHEKIMEGEDDVENRAAAVAETPALRVSAPEFRLPLTMTLSQQRPGVHTPRGATEQRVGGEEKNTRFYKREYSDEDARGAGKGVGFSAGILSFQVTLTDAPALVAALLQQQSKRRMQHSSNITTATEEEHEHYTFTRGTRIPEKTEDFAASHYTGYDMQRLDGIDMLLQLLRARLAWLWWTREHYSRRRFVAVSEVSSDRQRTQAAAAPASTDPTIAACAAAVAATRRARRCASCSGDNTPGQHQLQQQVLIPLECLVSAIDWTASLAPGTSSTSLISSSNVRSKRTRRWNHVRKSWWRSSQPAVMAVLSPYTSELGAPADNRGGFSAVDTLEAATATALLPGITLLDLSNGEEKLQVEVVGATAATGLSNSNRNQWRFLVAAGCSVPGLLEYRNGWRTLAISNNMSSAAAPRGLEKLKQRRGTLLRWEQLQQEGVGCSFSRRRRKQDRSSSLFSWKNTAAPDAAAKATPDEAGMFFADAAVGSSPAVLVRVQAGGATQQQWSQQEGIADAHEKGEEIEEGSWSEISSSVYIDSSVSVSCSVSNPLLAILFSSKSYALPLLLATDSVRSETNEERSGINTFWSNGKSSSSSNQYTSTAEKEVVIAHACVLQQKRRLSVAEHLRRLLLLAEQQQQNPKHDSRGGSTEDEVGPYVCTQLLQEEVGSSGFSLESNVNAAAAALAAGVAPVAIAVYKAEAKITVPFSAATAAIHATLASPKINFEDIAASTQQKQRLLTQHALQQQILQRSNSSDTAFPDVSGCLAWPLQRRMLLLYDPTLMHITSTETVTIHIQKRQRVTWVRQQQRSKEKQQRKCCMQKEKETGFSSEDNEVVPPAKAADESEDFLDSAAAAALLRVSRFRSNKQEQPRMYIKEEEGPAGQQLPVTFFVYPVPPVLEGAQSEQQEGKHSGSTSVEASVTSDAYRVVLQQKGLLLAVRVQAVGSAEVGEDEEEGAAAADTQEPHPMPSNEEVLQSRYSFDETVLLPREGIARTPGSRNTAGNTVEWEAPAAAQVMLECRAWRQLLTVHLDAAGTHSKAEQQQQGDVAADEEGGQQTRHPLSNVNALGDKAPRGGAAAPGLIHDVDEEQQQHDVFWSHYLSEEQNVLLWQNLPGRLRKEAEEEEETEDAEEDVAEEGSEDDAGSVVGIFFLYGLLLLLLLGGGWIVFGRHIDAKRKAAAIQARAAAMIKVKREKEENTYFFSRSGEGEPHGSCSSPPAHGLLERGRALAEVARIADTQLLMQQRQSEQQKQLLQRHQQQNAGRNRLLYSTGALDCVPRTSVTATEEGKATHRPLMQGLVNNWQRQQQRQPRLQMQPNGEWVWVAAEK